MASLLHSHSFFFYPWEAMLFHFFHCSYYFTQEKALTFKHIPSDTQFIPRYIFIIFNNQGTEIILVQEPLSRVPCSHRGFGGPSSRNGSMWLKGLSTVLAGFCTGTMD